MNADMTRRQLAVDLVKAGLRPAGMVLAHTSLSSLGNVPGGAQTVVAGLLDALGTAGTLLMPALSYEQVGPGRPRFDVRHTPSNVGTIPEFFRTRPGTLRSLHPTHSVCGVGPRARELLGEHHLDRTPCGPHSPFRRLPDAGGQILFLGCGLEPNTSMHGVEELVEPPYLFSGSAVFEVVMENGQRRLLECRCHNFQGWGQRYDRLGPLLKGEGLTTGRVLAATVQILDAASMWKRGEEALRQEPFFFVEPLPQNGVQGARNGS